MGRGIEARGIKPAVLFGASRVIAQGTRMPVPLARQPHSTFGVVETFGFFRLFPHSALAPRPIAGAIPEPCSKEQTDAH